MAEHKDTTMITYFWNWFIVAIVVIKGISSTSTSPFVLRNASAIRQPKNNKAIDNFQYPSLPLTVRQTRHPIDGHMRTPTCVLQSSLAISLDLCSIILLS